MVTSVKIRNAYDKKKGSTIDTGRGKTEQSHKRETDMNYILRDYTRTGFIKHAMKHEGVYDDVTAQDFQDAMFIVKSAQSMFEELPAAIRKRFGNDPAQFYEFTQNPSNEDEMRSLGILKGNDGIDIKGAAVNVPIGEDSPAVVEGVIEPKTE
jgi:phage internal scaffolding protein